MKWFYCALLSALMLFGCEKEKATNAENAAEENAPEASRDEKREKIEGRKIYEPMKFPGRLEAYAFLKKEAFSGRRIEDIALPEGAMRKEIASDWASWVRRLPLLEKGEETEAILARTTIEPVSEHTKEAGMAMLLRAWFALSTNRSSMLRFYSDQGDLLVWPSFMNGRRFVPDGKTGIRLKKISGARVVDEKNYPATEALADFMQTVCLYSSALSLARSMPAITETMLAPGDIFVIAPRVSPDNPAKRVAGHVAIVLDIAKDPQKKPYLLIGKGDKLGKKPLSVLRAKASEGKNGWFTLEGFYKRFPKALGQWRRFRTEMN